MPPRASNQRFYSDLPAFADFHEIADLDAYRPIPDNWFLLISDVVGSTRAIESGNYKTVNMVGAASITAVTNLSGALQLPYAFGGDGSLIAIPPELINAATREMQRLQAASTEMFGLALRAAAIPISDLRVAGADTLVRKFRLSKGNDLAMFAGSGPRVADQWLKADATSSGYALQPGKDAEPPNLDGLSCRWQPLKSRNGNMLTLILLPVAGADEAEIVSATAAINRILGGQISDFAPAHDETLRFRFPFGALSLEIAAGGRRSSRLKRAIWVYFTALMQYFCERFDIRIGDYDGTRYRYELQSNTDYRKFDGALRMVLDVTARQSAEIVSYLDREYDEGRLLFGSWVADEALMTCLLFDLSCSQHIHFIDGANGGYAMAAKDMKRRMDATSAPDRAGRQRSNSARIKGNPHQE